MIATKFDFLKKIHIEFQKLFKNGLRFNQENKREFTVIALYASIYELTGSCIFLLSNSLESRCHPIGVPLLLRGMLEAYVDLHNLAQDPDYMNILDYTFLRISGSTDEKEEFKRSHPGIKEVNTIEKKFKKTGAPDLYEVYRNLCNDTHNNLFSLFNRHTKDLSTDGSPELVVYRAYRDEEILAYISSNIDIFLHASTIVHKISCSPFQDKLNSYTKDWEAIEKHLPKKVYHQKQTIL